MNSIKLFYRYICKNISLESNRQLFRKELLSNEYNKDKINSFFSNYLIMKHHINSENELLNSYNINVTRDNMKEIRSVARRCGLEI